MVDPSSGLGHWSPVGSPGHVVSPGVVYVCVCPSMYVRRILYILGTVAPLSLIPFEGLAESKVIPTYPPTRPPPYFSPLTLHILENGGMSLYEDPKGSPGAMSGCDGTGGYCCPVGVKGDVFIMGGVYTRTRFTLSLCGSCPGGVSAPWCLLHGDE